MAQKRPTVQRHLMTPGQPRPQRPDSMSISSVQKWVMSILAATTIMHLSAGLVLAAVYSDRTSSQVGLLVISAAFGVIAILAALLIHQVRLLSPWLLLGLAPSLVGGYLIFAR